MELTDEIILKIDDLLFDWAFLAVYLERIVQTEDKISIGERFNHDDKNILPSKKAAEAHLALMQLHQLRDCYRQGWLPDWKNNFQEKYCIEFSDYQYKIFKYFVSCRFLSFQSKEIVEKFLNNFQELIKLAGDLI